MTQRARARTAAVTAVALGAALVPVSAAAAAAADSEPPVGSFVILSASSSDDPGPMVVEVVQSSLKDDVSESRAVVREVNWGTGVGFEPWRKGTSVDFAYTTVGRYDLRVRVTDEAGNAAVESLGTVVVTDSFAPRLSVNEPASHHRRVWRDVRGYAHDVGLAGLDFVRVKAVQERATGWFAYRGEDRGWVRAAGFRAARKAARPERVTTSGNGAWAVSLKGVRAGRLFVRSFARDHEGNRSKAVVVERTLVG